eukprot:1152678-Pelagomonas_calceolata.AAC.1
MVTVRGDLHPTCLANWLVASLSQPEELGNELRSHLMQQKRSCLRETLKVVLKKHVIPAAQRTNLNDLDSELASPFFLVRAFKCSKFSAASTIILQLSCPPQAELHLRCCLSLQLCSDKDECALADTIKSKLDDTLSELKAWRLENEKMRAHTSILAVSRPGTD